MSLFKPTEEDRWVPEMFGFKTPKEFEARRREPWVTADTRNHAETEQGLRRERRLPDDIEVVDHNFALVQQLVIGRTIVAFDRDPDTGVSFSHAENSVTLTLDDGSRLSFVGDGYDASSLITTYEPTGG